MDGQLVAHCGTNNSLASNCSLSLTGRALTPTSLLRITISWRRSLRRLRFGIGGTG